MGTVTVSIYGNNGTLDTDTCLNKYAEILAYIKEEVNNVHENSEKCRKVHEYINEKSALLNECNIRKHLSLDLNDSNEIKSFKEKCNKHLEDISKPALQEQQDTKFKLEEEKSPGQSEESGQKSKTAKVKGGASQKESNEAPPTISISEGQQSGDDGKEYAEVDGSIRGQVSPQDQHDTTLHSSADEAQEVKTLAQLSQQSGKYEHQQKEMELIFASDNEGETESNDCQNKPSSSCSLEGKSDEAGTPQAKGLKEASKQGDTQDENAVVLSTLQNPYSEGNMTQHSDHEIILTELCSDTTHSGITSSAEVGASKAPNNVTSHSVDSGNQNQGTPESEQHQPNAYNVQANNHEQVKSQSTDSNSDVNSDQREGKVTLSEDSPVVIIESNQPNEGNEGVPYKKYILMILVPLVIILLLAFLIKFTPIRMLFVEKKKKKRKPMNQKLQRALSGPSTEKERCIQFSYSYFEY